METRTSNTRSLQNRLTSYNEILRKLVFSFGDMAEDAFADLSAPWTEINVKRKQVLTREGETEKYLYLVLEGVQRAYCEHYDKDATLVFSYPYSFSGIIDSFFLQQPSRFHLEALTASRLLRIHYNDMNLLIKNHRSIESWIRMALTKVLADTLQRQIELLSYSTEEKFTALLHRSPHVLNLIPHKYLASYIGVDATNFSKLLGTIRLK
jgi:CRP-like cAMP-binding protein